MNARTFLIGLGVWGLAALLGACNVFQAAGAPVTAADATARPARVQVGDLAPEINLPSLNGDRIVLSALQGRPVLVNFWATWCGPCREEFPALVRKSRQYKDAGLVVIGVNFQDDNTDEGILTFMRNTNVDFLIVRDVGERVGRAYRVNGLPTSVFIDTKGIVRDIVVGGPMTDEFIDQQVLNLK